jgi:RNA polymerase sigma-70 factor (ECF subfamily)
VTRKKLLGILSPDAVFVADGGGKVPSILNPIYGADRISRFFIGVREKDGEVFEIHPATVNSGPGMLIFRNRQLVSVASVSIQENRIIAIYSVNNPDKIR